MKNSIIDTHAHLDMAPFNKDRPEVIARASEAGVSTIITVGIDLESSRKAVKLAEKYPGVLATAGFHPHEASRVRQTDIAELGQIASHPRVVAIGEMGLDFYRNRSPQEAQLPVLKWQLELSAEMDLPAIIHCRQADKDTLALLRDWTLSHKQQNGHPRGVIHCFSGDISAARQYLDMGFFISFGAYIGYPTSSHLHSVIRSIPEDKLVAETDCPFLPPQRHRGKRNEPAYVLFTVESLARIRQVSAETIASQTTQNARYLFNLPEAE